MNARRIVGLSVCIITLLVVIAAGAGVARAEAPYVQDWAQQCGTTSNDESKSVAVDSFGGVYITGETWGSLVGTNAGLEDAFLVKYNNAGTRLWTRQLGTSALDISNSVAVNGSGVYITGHTGGTLHGTSAGGEDVFLSKYDVSGNPLWTRQFGTNVCEEGNSVAVNASGIYITGQTGGSLNGGTQAGLGDAFLAKYNDSGVLQWTRQFGTSASDKGHSVAVGGSSVYITGETGGDLNGQTNAGNYNNDAFLTKYDESGVHQWTRLLGTTDYDAGKSVAVDGSGVYIAGLTTGDLDGTNEGGFDAFLAKYDTSGNLQWTRQIGTGVPNMDHDGIDSVVVDGSGDVYVTGCTEGDLGGTNAGNDDAFLAKYDGLGNQMWIVQFGTEDGERWNYVAVDGSGVYISGETGGDLGGTNAGGYDAYLVKYVPEPASFVLLGLGGIALLKRRRRAAKQ